MDEWQRQQAKNPLSELVREAREAGPQRITLRGEEAVVVGSARAFRRLAGRESTLAEFLRNSPLSAVALDAARSRDTGSTALAHDLAVARRNVEDLERCGARCVDPWHESWPGETRGPSSANHRRTLPRRPMPRIRPGAPVRREPSQIDCPRMRQSECA